MEHSQILRPLRVAILAAALFAVGALAAQARAATYTVGTTSDTASGTACLPSSGTCSLRELIEFENNQKPPATPDTINVPAGYYGLSNGALTVKQSVSIVGGGARSTEIQQIASTPDRVFDIQIPTNPTTGAQSGPIPTVVISGFRLQGGTAGSNNGYFGGDLRSDGSLTLSEDWITGGSASSGGGISNYGGTLTVTHTLVSSNAANSGGADSGGIQNYGPNPVTSSAGVLKVDNSTIAKNTSSLGGGIFSWGDGKNSTAVVNSTIAYNDGGTRSTTGGGLLTSGGGTITVQNAIVAFNTVSSGATASNCGGNPPAGDIITSLGHNLETGSDCGFKAAGDLQNTDPKFTSSSPQNNGGGNTDTLALHAASPAVDEIPPGSANCTGTDQRDVTRPQGTGCDIGAYEAFQPAEGTQFAMQVAVAGCQVLGSVTINWGDGTSSAANTKLGPIVGTHTYSEEGIYTGSVTWQDDCGSHNVSFDVKVVDAGLAAIGTAFNANAGQAFSGPIASFTDADPGGTASDYTATINWGDGATSPGTVTGTGPFTVNGSHTYAAGGSYPVSVSVADAGGASAATTSTASVAPEKQPTLTPGSPLVTSTTSAAFVTTVNPEGLVTQVYFQYGPALTAARDVRQLAGHTAAATTYTASTPTQTIGPDYSNHTVTASVGGLLPNTTYHVRAVATNSQGTAVGPDQTLTTPADPVPPPPVLGKSVDVTPVSGVVFIKLPNGKSLYASDRATGAASGLTKGAGFVPLTEARQLPSGTQIDARLGTIQLVAATPQRHKTQSGDFTGGLFGFAQDRRGINKGLTTLSLLEGAFPGAPSYVSCQAKPAADASSPTAYAAALSRQALQTLHASAHGRFRTRGRYAAATVRGTAWTTTDRCDGTLVSVQRHVVAVTDLVRHVTLLVHQGHSYLARAPSRRRG